MVENNKDKIRSRRYMVKTTIRSGNYDVVEYGTFYMDNSESEVIIHLVIENKFIGDIKIHFVTIQQVPGNKIEAEIIKDGELLIKCINFNSGFGTGTRVPMEIGYADGKKIFLHLWSYLLGEMDAEQGSLVRKVEYSILKEI